jgi:hypothetical protein
MLAVQGNRNFVFTIPFPDQLVQSTRLMRDERGI